MQAECATKQTRQLATKTCCMQQIIQIMQHNWIYSFLSVRRGREKKREGEGDRTLVSFSTWLELELLCLSCAFRISANSQCDRRVSSSVGHEQETSGMRHAARTPSQTALSATAAAFNCCPIRLVPANVSGMKQHLSQHESQHRKCCKAQARSEAVAAAGTTVHWPQNSFT